MAPYADHPTIDIRNPFYCPSIPARAYIHALHKDLARTHSCTTGDPRGNFAGPVRNPYVRILARALDTPGNDPSDKGIQDSDSDTSGSLSVSSTSTAASGTSISASSAASGNEQFHSAASRQPLHGVKTRSRTAAAGNITTEALSHDVKSSNGIPSPPNRFNRLRDSHLLARPPRKRKERRHNPDDSDSEDRNLHGPPKHARSFLGREEKSFEVRLKREPLNFDLASSKDSDSPTSPLLLELESSVRASQSLKASSQERGEFEVMWSEIQQAAPGIRIPAHKLGDPNLIAAHLADNGLLNAPLMRIIGKYSGVSELSLSPSVYEHNGLNLGRVTELLPELHAPGLFKDLTRLMCSGVPLFDDAVLHFHYLPLRVLNLCKTGITNAAVFMLVSHKDTLNQLYISNNPTLDDDVVPALMMFKQLSDLAITGTRITMHGLRRYAKAIHKEKRVIRIEMPSSCERYIDEQMHKQYLVVIDPPLLSQPEQCSGQRSVDLKKNLTAHWIVNRNITTSGNRSELTERLLGILEQREQDLLVKMVLENARARGEPEEASEKDDDGDDDDGRCSVV